MQTHDDPRNLPQPEQDCFQRAAMEILELDRAVLEAYKARCIDRINSIAEALRRNAEVVE